MNQIRYLLAVHGVVKLPGAKRRVFFRQDLLKVWKFKTYKGLH